MKIKSMDEIVDNYMIGTVLGAYKTKRYWMQKGFSEERSIENAVKYAKGQLKAGTSKPADHATIFREISEISELLANFLDMMAR